LENLNKYLPLIVVIGFIAWVLVSSSRRNKSIETLKDNFIIVEGEFKQIGRFEIGVNTNTIVSYNIDGKEIEYETGRKLPCKNFNYYDKGDFEEVMAFKFPVAVSKSDNSIVLPLITERDFTKIDKRLPDSLKRINEKYFNCNWRQRHIWK